MQKRKLRKNNDELANSDDEYVRPLLRMNENNFKFVEPAELAKKLQKVGLKIFPIGKDGNCLFRAVAHQLYGDEGMHDVVRRQCMDYMEKERNHFSQFLTEDFTAYVNRKRKNTVYGNHLELQAIAELYNRPILIYTTSEDAINLFQEEYKTDNPPMRLSYHFGNHYNSVYDPNNPTFGVGFGLPDLVPGEADRKLVSEAIQVSEQSEVDGLFVKQAITESEQQQLTQEFMEQAIEESEQQHLTQQIMEEIKKKTEVEEIEKQLLEDEIMESIKEQTRGEQQAWNYEIGGEDWQEEQILQMAIWENLRNK